MKTTLVALGTYFENFIQSAIAQGHYNNASEVVNSGIAEDLAPQQHMRTLKTQRHN